MKSLTRTEEYIMQVLWDIEQGFLKEIVDKMGPPIPHSNTVATILKILVEKEFVSTETVGRNNLYKPVIKRDEYAKRSVDNILKKYFQGSASKLISQFVDDKKIKTEELEQLLKDLRNKKRKP